MPQQNIKQVKGATQGSVLFLGTNGVVRENNSRLYWDNTNTRLSVGTASPAARLHIETSASLATPLIIASGSTTVDMVRITQLGAGNAFVVEDQANPDTSAFVIDASGNLGVGTGSVTTHKLNLIGNVQFVGGTFRYAQNAVSGYILVSDANGVASWTASTNIFSNADNGLTYSGGNVGLGGTLSRPTFIQNGNNSFTMSTTNVIEFYKNLGGTTYSHILNTTGALVRAVTSTGHNLLSVDDSSARIEVRDIVSGSSFSNIKIFNFDQTSFDGSDVSTNNRMVVRDDYYSKGLIYYGDYSANFTNNSLVTKAYVDSVSGGTFTASNGLTYSGGVVKLGGNLTEPTTITSNGYDFIMTSTSSIIELNRKATFGGHTHSLKLDVGASELKMTNGTDTFRFYNNSSGGLYSRIDAVDVTGLSYSRLHNVVANIYLQSTDGVELSQFLASPASISMATNENNLTFWTASQVIGAGDGSSNNTMIVTDNNGKGLVYSNDYTANFTTHSLVTKGYVTSAMSSSKAVDTRGFTASIAETITHNLNSSNVIVQNYNSSGVQIIADTITILGTGSISVEFSQTLSSVKTIII